MRFGEFTVDLAAGEVHKNGVKIRLQDLPFRVLAELASRPGQVVTREELRARLWGAETFVDAEAGLNTAVAKLREALGDSAETPRFVETVPKRGYRFIAEVEAGPAPKGTVPRPASNVQRARLSGISGFGYIQAAAAFIVVVITIIAVQRNTATSTTIAVVLFHNETGRPEMDRLAQQLTDATVVALAGNKHYAVIGNAAILRTPRIFSDLKKIGEELKAEYVLVAQLQNPADGLIVRAHFIRTSDQKHLWAKGITGTEADLEERVVEVIRAGTAASLGK